MSNSIYFICSVVFDGETKPVGSDPDCATPPPCIVSTLCDPTPSGRGVLWDTLQLRPLLVPEGVDPSSVTSAYELEVGVPFEGILLESLLQGASWALPLCEEIEKTYDASVREWAAIAKGMF